MEQRKRLLDAVAHLRERRPSGLGQLDLTLSLNVRARNGALGKNRALEWLYMGAVQCRWGAMIEPAGKPMRRLACSMHTIDLHPSLSSSQLHSVVERLQENLEEERRITTVPCKALFSNDFTHLQVGPGLVDQLCRPGD